MKFRESKTSRGYTLVETLIAVSIFSISILGLLVTLSKGISDTGYAKKKIVAAYLAQEGVEYFRNMRDTYVLYTNQGPDRGWGDFKSYLDPCKGPHGCSFDPLDAAAYGDKNMPMSGLPISSCPEGGCATLRYDPNTGAYGSFGTEDSGFTRTMNVEEITADEVKVTATVSWQQGSGNYSISLSDNLFNWIE